MHIGLKDHIARCHDKNVLISLDAGSVCPANLPAKPDKTLWPRSGI